MLEVAGVGGLVLTTVRNIFYHKKHGHVWTVLEYIHSEILMAKSREYMNMSEKGKKVNTKEGGHLAVWSMLFQVKGGGLI
jgi:hypothetical protein